MDQTLTYRSDDGQFIQAFSYLIGDYRLRITSVFLPVELTCAYPYRNGPADGGVPDGYRLQAHGAGRDPRRARRRRIVDKPGASAVGLRTDWEIGASTTSRAFRGSTGITTEQARVAMHAESDSERHSFDACAVQNAAISRACDPRATRSTERGPKNSCAGAHPALVRGITLVFD